MITINDGSVPLARMVIFAKNESRRDQALQLLEGDVVLHDVIVVEDGLHEGPPQDVHVADGHRREVDLIQRDCLRL